MDTWTITLHAESAAKLQDKRTRATLTSAASALAERFNIPLSGLAITDGTLTATLETEEATAVGFAAELRRTTNAWYEARTGLGPLWRTPSPDDEAPDIS